MANIPPVPKRVRTTQGTAVRWYDRRDQYKLLRTVQQHSNTRDNAIIKVLLHVGLRVAELCAAQWTDVTITKRKGTFTVRQGKGSKYREVPLNRDARRALESIGYAEHAGSALPIFNVSSI